MRQSACPKILLGSGAVGKECLSHKARGHLCHIGYTAGRKAGISRGDPRLPEKMGTRDPPVLHHHDTGSRLRIAVSSHRGYIVGTFRTAQLSLRRLRLAPDGVYNYPISRLIVPVFARFPEQRTIVNFAGAVGTRCVRYRA